MSTFGANLLAVAISSEEVEVPVRVMMSLVRFRIVVLIQVPRIFPCPIQLLKAGLLLLCGFGQFLSLHFQLEGSWWWFWQRRRRHGWKRRPHMDFHYNTLEASLKEHDEHAERRSDNYSQARSRPN